MSPTVTKATKDSKKAAKRGEALKKEARKEIAERIEAIDAGKEPPAAAPQAKPKSKTKPAKAPRETKRKRLGVLEAAAQVLKDSGKPLTAAEIMQVITEQKLWSSQGKTPHQTLFAAAIREIKAKADQARFTKPEAGKFAFNAARKEG
jgi:hypothetical protein